MNRLIRATELIAATSDADSARTYYHYASDEMGSITHIVDEAGKVQNRYEYDAWGNITAQEENVPNRFKFTGQQFDPVAQQYYLRARFYNPVVARFTQEDTYRGDGLNLYAYCANNPTFYRDPTGNTSQCMRDAWLEAKKAGATKEEAYAAAQAAYEKNHTDADSRPQVDVPDDRSMSHEEWDKAYRDARQASGDGSELRKRLVNINNWDGDVNDPSVRLYGTYDELRAAGVKDGHHIVQNAAVRDVAGYKQGDAPAIQADGPSTTIGSEHYNLTYDQSHATTGGTYGIEKNIGLNSVQNNLDLSLSDVETLSSYLDGYFSDKLGLTDDTPLRIPGNRHHIQN